MFNISTGYEYTRSLWRTRFRFNPNTINMLSIIVQGLPVGTPHFCYRAAQQWIRMTLFTRKGAEDWELIIASYNSAGGHLLHGRISIFILDGEGVVRTTVTAYSSMYGELIEDLRHLEDNLRFEKVPLDWDEVFE